MGLLEPEVRSTHPVGTLVSEPRDLTVNHCLENIEITAYHILRLLRCLRNRLRPAKRLPPEIISYTARQWVHKIDDGFGAKSIKVVPCTVPSVRWRSTLPEKVQKSLNQSPIYIPFPSLGTF
jgi:hypothetical protein